MKLEDVLEGYAMESPEGNDPQILRKWISDFPQFSDDLMAFAAERARVRHLPDPVLTAEEKGEAMNRGRAALQRFREEQLSQSASISSLTALAKQRGMKKGEFARTVGFSLSLLMQLDKRNVKPSTVPFKIIQKIAVKLEVAADAIRAYLELPQMAAEGNFKAEARPDESPQIDFAEAVRKDTELSDDEKRDLLE
ncbi:MAG: hypothetical protein J5I65_16225 [Aridibacter famidurans]|nr:hypothetical protein [Aridibacter famidurans]